MRAKFLLTTISVLALGIAGNITSVKADDVYVDLSVLDSLGENNSPVINQGPLFPVMSPAEAKASRKVVKPKKKISSNKAKKQKIEETKTEEVIKVPEKETIKVDVLPVSDKIEKTENKTETKTKVETQPAISESKAEDKNIQPKTVSVPASTIAPAQVKTEVNANLENKTDTKVEAKTEVKEDAKPEASVDTKPVVAPVEENVSDKKNTDVVTENKAVENKKVVNIDQILTKQNPKTENVSASVAEPATQPEAKAEVPSLLIKENQTQTSQNLATNSTAEIFFAIESDELTEENKTQIDAIIAGFENPKENKIAIYSFNLNDGEDSFRKKRLSLNRAIAVRSYLLGKGYKNFSIKVVNLNEADGKENSVRVEELK